ncbi:MAG: hypothetical protein CHACPFDD_03645 [Phycisphaerae bacterium]|nr:hypothetical protein [Phycisphaerae bacterium]
MEAIIGTTAARSGRYVEPSERLGRHRPDAAAAPRILGARRPRDPPDADEIEQPAHVVLQILRNSAETFAAVVASGQSPEVAGALSGFRVDVYA